MAKYTGNDIAVTFGGTSISNITSVDIQESRGEYDGTAAGQSDAEYLAGKRNYTVTINFLDDSAEAGFQAFDPTAAEATLVIYPQGNSTGKPSRTMTAFVTARNRPLNHDGLTNVTVQLRVNGAITDATVV